MTRKTFIVVVAATTVLALATSSTVNKALIGVDPKDASLYSGKTFKCPGSGKVISIDQVNDNYCDCPAVPGVTITDEPGTGACSNAVFYCNNHKYRPTTIPASRVNDGVCDCCDGSDEWLFPEPGRCKDTCKELGKKSYEEDKAKYEGMKKAIDNRNKFVAESSKELTEKTKSLSGLNKIYNAQKKTEDELNEVQKTKKEALNKKEEEIKKIKEERERIKKEKEEKEKEQKEKEAEVNVVVEPAPTLADDMMEGMMGRENDNIVEQIKEGKEEEKKEEEKKEEEEKKKEEEEEPEDPELTRLKKEWEEANDEYLKASNKAYETKRKIDELEEILKYDFGEDKCFYSIYDKCVSVVNGEYTYEVCSYKKGSQKKGGSTSLGNWAHWKDDSGHTVMEYNDGQRCFNGKHRSLTVTLECGEEYKAIEASEPAMCEYAMRVATPCACSPDELKAIEENIRNYETA